MDLANGHIDAGKASNALLVLVLPCDPERTWQTEELDAVTAIAGQVSIAIETQLTSSIMELWAV